MGTASLRTLLIPALGALAGALLAAACGDDGGTGGSGGAGAGGAAQGGAGGAGGAGGVAQGAGGVGGAAQGGAGGAGGAGGGCVDSLPALAAAPATLSESGLYADVATDTLSAAVREFAPAYPLWSDGAEKRRFAYIPECATIDTTDMDTWQVPVGSRFWKEFTRDGVRIETRLTIRTGPGAGDFDFATYVWDDGEGAEPVRVTDGVPDALGTGHDVPAESLCSACHKNSWRVLGFSALQLSHAGPGETMASLSAEGKLSVPKPEGVTLPGDDVAKAALGYLHANCGNCHHQGGVPSSTLRLKALDGQSTVETTDIYTTSVNQPINSPAFMCGGCDRIEPGDPDASGIVQRMELRGGGQMPPFATELLDPTGSGAVRAWIATLPP